MDADVFKYIDIEKTIAELGYDPRELKRGSNKLAFGHCFSCGKERGKKRIIVLLKSKSCRHCFQTKELKERVSKSVSLSKKGTKRAPFSQEWKNKIGESQKGKKRSKEFCEKMSLRFRGSKSHFYGKTTPHGKGEWYTNKNGNKFFMRSQWEIKYAIYLDLLNINWEFEHKSFNITFKYKNEIKEGTYRPDFYVNGEWIEIKGYWRDDAKAKFEAFKEQYPNEKITLLMKPELLALGIDVK